MPTYPTAPSAAPQSWRRDLLLLAVSFGALYFALLGGHPLSNPDEGRLLGRISEHLCGLGFMEVLNNSLSASVYASEGKTPVKLSRVYLRKPFQFNDFIFIVPVCVSRCVSTLGRSAGFGPCKLEEVA
jgi:hypothetical protein